jgi:dCMP deaminase
MEFGSVELRNKDYQFMDLCVKASEIFSTCSRRSYAAVLVGASDHIIGMGYNGVPSGMLHCVDGGCPRTQGDVEHGSSYHNCYAVHAEANALLHSDFTAKPVSIYVNGPPCFECAKLIANTDIVNIFYLSDPSYKEWPKVEEFLNSLRGRRTICLGESNASQSSELSSGV